MSALRRLTLPLCLALAALPACAWATAGKYDPVACPVGQSAQMRADEIEQALAPYQATGLDPVPEGSERPLPKPNWRRAVLHDRDYPAYGSANAVLLVGEDGSVERVIVPCASSPKMIALIVETFSAIKLAAATRGGKPVKSSIVVPLAF